MVELSVDPGERTVSTLRYGTLFMLNFARLRLDTRGSIMTETII